MEEKTLVEYYNKFCEDKRLLSRHGQVEFRVTMEYIKKYLGELKSLKVLDVGAGTGRYSFMLQDLGAEVTAVELVKYNLGILKSKRQGIEAYQGDARDLKRFKDETFDAVLLFGPLYHLFTEEDKLQALKEAKRVLKMGGILFVSYLMADYAIITHGFRDGNIIECVEAGKINNEFKINNDSSDLYDYVRLEDIDNLKDKTEMKRLEVISQDGASDYIRATLNKMTEKEFEMFIKYQLSVSGRKELLGASSHVLDILQKI